MVKIEGYGIITRQQARQEAESLSLAINKAIMEGKKVPSYSVDLLKAFIKAIQG